MTVPLDVTPHGGATPDDYTTPSQVTFNAGQTTAAFTVTAADDNDNDDGESITIGFGNLPTGVTAGTPFTTTVNLDDNDTTTTPTVRFGASQYAATEGGAAAAVTVELTTALTHEVTVPVTATPKGGATTDDYTLSPTPVTVTFAAGHTTATFEVTATDDNEADSYLERLELRFGTLPAGVAKGSRATTAVFLRDNDPAEVVSRRVTSTHKTPDWYTAAGTFKYTPVWYTGGDTIKFTLEFSQPVAVVGDPRLEFNVDTPANVDEFADYLSGSGTTELVFAYTVGTSDDDPNGISWHENSLSLDADDTIKHAFNQLDANRDHTADNVLDGHRIDQEPRANQKVTSVPTHGSPDTYGADDRITFEVKFNQAVTVAGDPRLRFSINGPGDKYADYRSGSGTDTLVFSYTVLATDADTDGIYLYADPLDLDADVGDVDSITGAVNGLAAVNTLNGDFVLAGHKIDGTITIIN